MSTGVVCYYEVAEKKVARAPVTVFLPAHRACYTQPTTDFAGMMELPRGMVHGVPADSVVDVVRDKASLVVEKVVLGYRHGDMQLSRSQLLLLTLVL